MVRSATVPWDFFAFTLPLLPAIPSLLRFAEGQMNNLSDGITTVIHVFERGLLPEPHFIVSVAFLRVF